MHRFNKVLLLFTVTLFLLFPAASVYSKNTALPQACMSQCRTPFGKVLGVGSGKVAAYSNCSAKCVDPVPYTKNGTYTGIKWQCVEYARRWLLVNKGVVYGDVDIAADIWGLKYVTRIKDKTKFRMINEPNGSTSRPAVGDLLIYAKAYLNTGHAAVISKVDRKAHSIYVLEENYHNEKWPGNYARRISYITRQGHYWILDTYVLGWKHITKQPYITAMSSKH